MKNRAIYLSIISATLLFISCKLDNKKTQEIPSEFTLEGKTFIVDTLLIEPIQEMGIIDNFKPDEYFKNTFLDITENPNENFIVNNAVGLDEACGDIPTSMNDLTGGLEKNFYKYSSSSNINLKILGWGGGELGKKELLIMTDFVQYKRVICSDGETRFYGVGARLFLHIKSRKRKVNLTLSQLAANVELNRAEVTYKIKTIGIVGDKVLDVLPTGSKFDVDNYAKVVAAIDNIIKLAKDNTEGVIIEPQLLPNHSK